MPSGGLSAAAGCVRRHPVPPFSDAGRLPSGGRPARRPTVKSWWDRPETVERAAEAYRRRTEGQPRGQIAKDLGISETTVDRDIKRGRSIAAGLVVRELATIQELAAGRREDLAEEVLGEVRRVEGDPKLSRADKARLKRDLIALALRIEDSLAEVVGLLGPRVNIDRRAVVVISPEAAERKLADLRRVREDLVGSSGSPRR